MPHYSKYTNGDKKKRKKVKSEIEGKVIRTSDGRPVRNIRPTPQVISKGPNKPGIGSRSAYVAETRRRHAADAERRRISRNRQKAARIAGSFSKAAELGYIRKRR